MLRKVFLLQDLIRLSYRNDADTLTWVTFTLIGHRVSSEFSASDELPLALGDMSCMCGPLYCTAHNVSRVVAGDFYVPLLLTPREVTTPP